MSTGFIFFRFAEQRSPWTSVDHNLDGLLNSGGFGRTIAFGRLVGGTGAACRCCFKFQSSRRGSAAETWRRSHQVLGLMVPPLVRGRPFAHVDDSLTWFGLCECWHWPCAEAVPYLFKRACTLILAPSTKFTSTAKHLSLTACVKRAGERSYRTRRLFSEAPALAVSATSELLSGACFFLSCLTW